MGMQSAVRVDSGHLSEVLRYMELHYRRKMASSLFIEQNCYAGEKKLKTVQNLAKIWTKNVRLTFLATL